MCPGRCLVFGESEGEGVKEQEPQEPQPHLQPPEVHQGGERNRVKDYILHKNQKTWVLVLSVPLMCSVAHVRSLGLSFPI